MLEGSGPKADLRLVFEEFPSETSRRIVTRARGDRDRWDAA